MIFDEENPFFDYRKDLFIESGYPERQIYIFKFARRGAKVEIYLDEPEPNAIVYRLIFGKGRFADDWEIDKNFPIKAFSNRNTKDLYVDILKELEEAKYGSKRQNSKLRKL